MATNRNVVLAVGEIYHVFNRGVERRVIFTNKREYQRATDTLSYYRHLTCPVKYSQLLNTDLPTRKQILDDLIDSPRQVEILAYCLMPNHYHFLLKQDSENGISRFISQFSDSYSKYFNTKHARVGPLFQGPFKAVRIETEEQLIHVSRYIHLNPVASFVIKDSDLESYPWTSLPEYLENKDTISNPGLVLGNFKSTQDYLSFVRNQIEYSQTLEKIKHLAIDYEE